MSDGPGDGPKATDRHLDPSATRRVFFCPNVDASALFTALRLDGEKSRVLVVEDDRSWFDALTKLLREMGHDVVAGAGASPAEPGRFVLHGFSGEADQTLGLGEFDVAFLDHYFPGGFDGRTLTAALRVASSKVRILGMSSSEAANVAMVRAGADLGMRKVELRRLLR